MHLLLEINDSLETQRLLCNLMGTVLGGILALWTLVYVLLVTLGNSLSSSLCKAVIYLLFEPKQKKDLWLVFLSSVVIFLRQYSSCIRVVVP